MPSSMMLTRTSTSLISRDGSLPEGVDLVFACFATVAIIFLALSSTVFYVSNPLRQPRQLHGCLKSPSLRALQEGLLSQGSSSDLSRTDLSLVYRGADPELRRNTQLLLEAFNYDTARLSEHERCSSNRASFIHLS